MIYSVLVVVEVVLFLVFELDYFVLAELVG
jgi:hypothetical protein